MTVVLYKNRAPFRLYQLMRQCPGRSAQRILERKTELASRIQARWRGVSVRRYLIVFRREIRRQRQVRTGMALRIQRATRGWCHRRLARRWRSQRAAQEAMEQYRCQGKAKADEDAQRCGSRRLFREYVRERFVGMMTIS